MNVKQELDEALLNNESISPPDDRARQYQTRIQNRLNHIGGNSMAFYDHADRCDDAKTSFLTTRQRCEIECEDATRKINQLKDKYNTLSDISSMSCAVSVCGLAVHSINQVNDFANVFNITGQLGLAAIAVTGVSTIVFAMRADKQKDLANEQIRKIQTRDGIGLDV